MEKHTLNELFNPNSIAVIGASDRPNSVGKLVFENILNGKYIGQVFPVNLRHSAIQGHRAYSSIAEMTQPIDVAIITTPAETVPDIIRQCGQKSVGMVIIISAGFSETGSKGHQFEQKILKIARQYHIRIMGPNCL